MRRGEDRPSRPEEKAQERSSIKIDGLGLSKSDIICPIVIRFPNGVDYRVILMKVNIDFCYTKIKLFVGS